MESEILHATAVAVLGKGIILRGASGSGKSDLAIRLIERGATLIADDYVRVTVRPFGLVLDPPPAITGKIEIRGLGVAELPWTGDVTLALVADLVAPTKIERMPEPGSCTLLGIDVPRIDIAPFEASATAKLNMALRAQAGAQTDQ